jgi:hypothetical protein
MNIVADSSPGSGSRVVGVELALDGDVAQQPLRAGHLLDLEPDGLAVFEDHRDDRTDRYPASPLQADDVAAEPVPLALVGAEVGDVVDSQFGHGVIHCQLPGGPPSGLLERGDG